MKHSTVFDTYTSDYEAWYHKYPEVFLSEFEAIKEQFQKLPENIKGVEIGLGTGRFAQILGIKEGVEPSEEMATLAAKKGIEVIQGVAENIPYKDLSFDFVLFVTICHLSDFKEALIESYRILKPKGSIIIGFIDKNRTIGKSYEEKRKDSIFFKNAIFYSVPLVTKMLKEAGFRNLEFNQTLFGELDEIKQIQLPKTGFGEGSFVVVKASKK